MRQPPAPLPRALPWTLVQHGGNSFIAIPAVSAATPLRAAVLVLRHAPEVRHGTACRLALQLEDAAGQTRLLALDACSPQAERSIADAGAVGVVEETAATANGIHLAYVATVLPEAALP